PARHAPLVLAAGGPAPQLFPIEKFGPIAHAVPPSGRRLRVLGSSSFLRGVLGNRLNRQDARNTRRTREDVGLHGIRRAGDSLLNGVTPVEAEDDQDNPRSRGRGGRSAAPTPAASAATICPSPFGER